MCAGVKIYSVLFFFLFSSTTGKVWAQLESDNSEVNNITFQKSINLTDSLQRLIVAYKDSLRFMRLETNDLKRFSNSLLSKIDSLNQNIKYWKYIADTLTLNNQRLIPVNRELRLQISNMERQIAEQNVLLEEQKRLVQQKEQMFKEKEEIYREALLSSKFDMVKLEGSISSKEIEIQAKKREIELLARNIEEKQSDLERKNHEINQLLKRREMTDKMVDSLRDTLVNAQKVYIQLTLEKRLLETQLKDCRDRLTARDKRGKPVAVVQGVAMRAYRTPLYILAPKDAQNITSYEIINENAGSFEFDMITGASVRITRLTPEDAKYSSDFGWFVGFGGKNLFKNFYIGPNVKVFDFIHINAGVNVAEFRVLKSGFKEGDVLQLGTPIPTVNRWKFTPYFTLSFDFEIITQVAGKL